MNFGSTSIALVVAEEKGVRRDLTWIFNVEAESNRIAYRFYCILFPNWDSLFYLFYTVYVVYTE